MYIFDIFNANCNLTLEIYSYLRNNIFFKCKIKFESFSRGILNLFVLLLVKDMQKLSNHIKNFNKTYIFGSRQQRIIVNFFYTYTFLNNLLEESLVLIKFRTRRQQIL